MVSLRNCGFTKAFLPQTVEIFHCGIIDSGWTIAISSLQTYYYHAKKRESVWTKPENVKIVKQTELQALAAAAGIATTTTTTTAVAGVTTAGSTAVTSTGVAHTPAAASVNPGNPNTAAAAAAAAVVVATAAKTAATGNPAVDVPQGPCCLNLLIQSQCLKGSFVW